MQIMKLNMLGMPIEDAPEASQTYMLALIDLRDFIFNIYSFGANPTLEDLFTLLDQTISKREYCHEYSWRKLEDIRDALNKLVLFLFHKANLEISEKGRIFYERIGLYFIEKRIRGKSSDPFSIISFNWDSLLEDSIYNCIRTMKITGGVDIDFCCYTNPLNTSVPHSSSLTQKAKGIFNIKLMKLHGSVNWLLCPNCNRLFTGVGGDKDIWLQYIDNIPCPSCKKVSSGTGKSAPLEQFFISPTFLKVFNNAHIQMTWHNAYLEIAGASKVVFVGYSLPEADYHFRTILRRAITKEKEIEVILGPKDRRQTNSDEEEIPNAESRFRSFFSGNKIKFRFGGLKRYFRKLTGSKDITLKAKQGAVKRLHAKNKNISLR